jgi:hypothetical protein
LKPQWLKSPIDSVYAKRALNCALHQMMAGNEHTHAQKNRFKPKNQNTKK